MRFEFVVLFLLYLHEIVSLKPYITEMSNAGEKHMLWNKQKNTAAEQNTLPTSNSLMAVIHSRCWALVICRDLGGGDCFPHYNISVFP